MTELAPLQSAGPMPVSATAHVQRSATPELRVSQPSDPLERESDRVADRVMRLSSDAGENATADRGSADAVVDLHGTRQDEGGISRERLAVPRGGQPLPQSVQDWAESALDVDLSGVRVHSGGEADVSARRVHADAYTLGSDIVFARDRFRPDSGTGRRLLAHELAHVVQGGSGSTATAGNATVLRQPASDVVASPGAAPASQRQFDTVQDFAATVRSVAVERMQRNSRTLETWRDFMREHLSPNQLMAQVLAQEARDLFAYAAQAGPAETAKANQWAFMKNPGARFLAVEQIHGRMRACTGCHVSNLAWQLTPTEGREWLSPTQQLKFASGGQRASRGEDVNSRGALYATPAELLDSMRSIQPFIEELGPRRYRVLPSDVMNRALTPEQLVVLVDQSITVRQSQYAEYVGRIRDGDVAWFDLDMVVKELLHAASPGVQRQVREIVEDVTWRRRVAEVLTTLAQIALLLLIVFPPTSAIAIGIGAVAGGVLIGTGTDRLERGLDDSLTIGADDVLSPRRQSQARVDLLGGGMDIFAGLLAAGGALLGAAARPVAGGDSSLTAAAASMPSTSALVGGMTFQRGGWTITAASDLSGFVATSSRYPGVLAFLEREGVALYSTSGGVVRLVEFRSWAQIASRGAQSAAGGGTASGAAATAVTPPQVGAPPTFRLSPGAPTDLTHGQILNLRGADRWIQSETFQHQMQRGVSQVHRPVAVDLTGKYPISRPGGRFTDESVTWAGHTIGIEVKTYGRWRTVEGVAQEQRVPLTNAIREQIHKDLAIRRADPTFDPRWVFTDAPPSVELQAYLHEVGIVAVWTP